MEQAHRADLRGSLIGANRAVNLMFDALAADVRSAVVAHATKDSDGKLVLTRTARTLIMRDVDAALDAWFGTRRGGPSVFVEAIVQRCAALALKAIRRASDEIAAESPEFVEAMMAARPVEQSNGR